MSQPAEVFAVVEVPATNLLPTLPFKVPKKGFPYPRVADTEKLTTVFNLFENVFARVQHTHEHTWKNFHISFLFFQYIPTFIPNTTWPCWSLFENKGFPKCVKNALATPESHGDTALTNSVLYYWAANIQPALPRMQVADDFPAWCPMEWPSCLSLSPHLLPSLSLASIPGWRLATRCLRSQLCLHGGSFATILELATTLDATLFSPSLWDETFELFFRMVCEREGALASLLSIQHSSLCWSQDPNVDLSDLWPLRVHLSSVCA